MRGKKKSKFHRIASKHRKRMIAANRRKHPKRRKLNFARAGHAHNRKFNNFDKITQSRSGKKALARYRKFWGIEFPTSVKQGRTPGSSNHEFLVGMGISPKVILADGPKGKETRKWEVKGKRTLATNVTGTRMFVLSGKNSNDRSEKLKFVGYAPETHYIPTKKMENAGTHKKGKYWIHKHDDDGGRWPKVYQDSAGNFLYGPGTYSVTDWIRK